MLTALSAWLIDRLRRMVRSIAFLFDLSERCLQGPIIVDVDGHIEVGLSGLTQQQLLARHPTFEDLIVAAYIGHGGFAGTKGDRE